MKIQLVFGKGSEILDDVVSYKKRKSLVSGLFYVTVAFHKKPEKTFSNVYEIITL